MTRKTKTALITVCLLLTVTVVYALAAAGGASDPLASLSYLTGTFTDAVDQRVEEKLDASDQALLNGDAAPSDGGAATWMETRLKAGDALTGSTGTGVLLLAGGMQVTFNSGAVVDVTTGTIVTSGSALTASHRYLVAEETTAVFTVTSKTAVVDYQGPYAFSYSTNTDYNAIAVALKTMHLFQGSFTGYGDGYDLEVAPTRLQALIMFIRVLGEENDALAYTGSTDMQELMRRAATDAKVREVIDAFHYRVAKEIGAMAAAMKGQVDQIILTGGIAHGQETVDALKGYVSWIAPVTVYPGEGELLALAEGALRVLRGEETAKIYE